MKTESGLHPAPVRAWVVDEETIEVGEVTDDVRALDALCVCGEDRGDHLVEPPHGSEDGCCPAFRSASEMCLVCGHFHGGQGGCVLLHALVPRKDCPTCVRDSLRDTISDALAPGGAA
jgi:hypothetical protein